MFSDLNVKCHVTTDLRWSYDGRSYDSLMIPLFYIIRQVVRPSQFNYKIYHKICLMINFMTLSKTWPQIFVHPVQKAEILNKHFSNISKIDIEPELPNNVPDPPVIMENCDILENEVFDQLSA